MKNALVAYGTRYGSTAIVANEIADHLKESGHGVDLVDLRKSGPPKKPGDYDLVIAGSSVAMFSWIGRVKGFLRTCRRAGAPTVVFICAGTAISDVKKAEDRFLTRVIDRIGIRPLAVEAVAPVLDFRPGVGMPEAKKARIRDLVKTMAGDAYREDSLMDLRDKARFAAFLKRIDELLKG